MRDERARVAGVSFETTERYSISVEDLPRYETAEGMQRQGQVKLAAFRASRQRAYARERGELVLCPACYGSLKDDLGDECSVCEAGEVTRAECAAWERFNAEVEPRVEHRRSLLCVAAWAAAVAVVVLYWWAVTLWPVLIVPALVWLALLADRGRAAGSGPVCEWEVRE